MEHISNRLSKVTQVSPEVIPSLNLTAYHPFITPLTAYSPPSSPPPFPIPDSAPLVYKYKAL